MGSYIVKYRVYNQRFDDVYFSIDDGLAEKKYIFIQGNELPLKWSHLKGKSFTIVETGFGTGLSFFATWEEFLKYNNFKLNYISIEKYPLAAQEIKEIILKWSELHQRLDCFIDNYANQILSGEVVINLSDNFTLTLLCGDIEEMLSYIKCKVDCWYLDGFSPSKNPQMWSNNLYKFMQEFTNKNGSFATYTVASKVRKSLESSGFSVKKILGYGNKKQMLKGVLL